MYKHQSSMCASAQRGFTLIEVLVSIVIVAFGLLGVAGLLGKGASLGVTAHNRTIATQKVYEMADLMRVNAQNTAYLNALTGLNATTAGACTAPTAPGCMSDTASGCSSATNIAALAQYDWGNWGQGLCTALGGSATGQVAAKGANVFTITVKWQERDSTLQTFAQQSYSMDVRP